MPPVNTIATNAPISKSVQSEPSTGMETAPHKMIKSAATAPINGRAGRTRNHQCLRTTRRTSSPGCCPEKCHCLLRPLRRFCKPKRLRPERQGSSGAVEAAALSFSAMRCHLTRQTQQDTYSLFQSPLYKKHTDTELSDYQTAHNWI